MINEIDEYLAIRLGLYRSRSLIKWLYNKYYLFVQYFTPFLKWSRWTFNQCSKNLNKLMDENTNYKVLHPRGSSTTYYIISVRFGYLKVTEKYVEPKQKKKIFSGFIFTKKQAIKAITKIKQNTIFVWDSDYCGFNTYWVDKILKDDCLTEEGLSFIHTELNDINEILTNPSLQQAYNDLTFYKNDVKRYKNQNIRLLKMIQKKLKDIKYAIIDKNDFKLY